MLPPTRQRKPLPCSRDQTLTWICWLLVGTAAGMAVLLALLPPAGHDQLWFLLMARRWLTGAELYGPQAFDSNPPGIVWLSAVPVLLGRSLHLPTTLVAKVLVTLAETGASTLSFILLRHSSRSGPERPAHAVNPAQTHEPDLPAPSWELPALLFAALVLFYVVPARDFGQRDHILSFLVLPYVLAAGLNPLQHRLTAVRCTAGLLAAVGIALKPHHALVPIAVELALILFPEVGARPITSPKAAYGATGGDRLRRLLRPEPVLLVLGGVAYLLAIRHFAPLYLRLALPIDRETYWAIGHLSVPQLALQAIELCLLALSTIGMFLVSSRRSRFPGLLIVAGVAATLVYVLQGTGWYYQQLPAISFLGAALTLDLLARVPHHTPESGYLRLSTPGLGEGADDSGTGGSRWGRPWIAGTAALGVLALALTSYFSGSPYTTARAYAPIFADPAVPAPDFFARLRPGAPVSILTTSVEAAMMPVERYHLTWAQRTDNLWLLPAILGSENSIAGSQRLTADRVRSLDALQHRWMVQDLTYWRPVLILVARCPNLDHNDPQRSCQELENVHALDRQQLDRTPAPDDLLAWFLRDPEFALLWRQYRWSGSQGDFDAYTLVADPH